MMKSKNQKANTVENIIIQTKELIKEGGLGNLSMRRIALHSGISLGHLQYHFKTQEILLLAVIQSIRDDYPNQLHYLKKTGDNKQDLYTVILFLLSDEIRRNDHRLFDELWSITKNNKVIANAMNKLYSDLYQLLYDIFAFILDENSPAIFHYAADILLPYLEGYGYVAPFIHSSSEEIAENLTSIILNQISK